MDLQCHACIGGGNVKEDFRKLEQGQHVVVGTPGRVLDMINRRALSEEGGGEGERGALSGEGQERQSGLSITPQSCACREEDFMA